MNYYEFNAGDKTYKLRLNTRSIVALEAKLGCNPLAIFGDGSIVPTVSTMVNVLHASMQQYHDNTSVNVAYSVFDSYLDDGNTMTDFIAVILEIYKVSGLIRVEAEEEKN